MTVKRFRSWITSWVKTLEMKYGNPELHAELARQCSTPFSEDDFVPAPRPASE
jgi:hypothetical protein